MEKMLSLYPLCEATSKKYTEIKQRLEIIIIAETEGARINDLGKINGQKKEKGVPNSS